MKFFSCHKTLSRNKEISNFINNIFGFRPSNLSLYNIAFTHKSVSRKDSVAGDLNNERLEFLGDAILSAIVTDFIFKKFPLYHEGQLTEMRSKLVNRECLNALSKKIGLYQLIQIDSNIYAKSVNGDAFEAVLGAIYLDKGYNKTKRIIINRIILTYIDVDTILSQEKNFKSKLLSWSQKHHYSIEFQHIEVESQHTNKLFEASILINGKLYGKGLGSTVKQAEQSAAEKCCEVLELFEKTS